MPKISVAIITKNEEKNIRACLESVRWTDEIVVVDGGSADRTKEICREFQAQVFEEAWKGFARQKNSAIEKTCNEWVLSLDADERISPELQKEIQDRLAADPRVDGFYIARKNFFAGRWIRYCGWYPDYNLRLFRKSRGRFEERTVHEKVKIRGRTEKFKTPLIHRTYRSLSDFLQRMDRYSTLAAQEMQQEGKKVRQSDLLFRPPFTFLQMYVLRTGFLEGYMGFLLSTLYSFYTFTKYTKLREMQRHEPTDAEP
jgi:glycosyltransferase involved in cell wall biosynthesis